MIVDIELKGRIQTELIKAILKFELKIRQYRFKYEKGNIVS